MSAQANPNYRVEHVATVPPGWKVRTKMQATHMLRIAFPPGRRRRGSGKVVEIFHPVNENPCAMQAKRQTRERAARIRTARLSNPSVYTVQATRKGGTFGHSIIQSFPTEREAREFAKTIDRSIYMKPTVYYEGRKNPSATESAAALYESFHGQSPRKILEMQESDAARHTYTALGDLRELVIDAPAGKVKIGFDGSDAVKVASAPGGKQIYLLGGNQNLDSQLGRFGSDTAKDFVELGAAVQITYRARKSMDNFTLVDYYHDLGEETGEPPFTFYDRLKRRIFLAGGRYRVEAPGIIN